MRRSLVLSTFILLASLYTLAACRVPAADEFQAQFDNWSRAYQAHDLDVSMRLFAPELVFESQDHPDLSFADLRAEFARQFAEMSHPRWIGHVDDVVAAGEVATVFSTWKAFAVRDGSQVLILTQRSADVFRPGAACNWRITHSLNYPTTSRNNRKPLPLVSRK